VANVPMPLAAPAVPEPATRVTTFVDNTSLRIMLSLRSAISAKVLAILERDTPPGLLNRAFVPTPLVLPVTPSPARVVTRAVDIAIWRMRCPLLQILTAKDPSEDMAMSIGLFRAATVPTPLAPPADPLPAKVLTTPVDTINLRILWLS
jgi:hypothetical protein